MFTGSNAKTKPLALDFDELPGRIEEILAKRAELEQRRAENRTVSVSSQDPTLRIKAAAQDTIYESQILDQTRQARSFEFEQHMRPALAVGCLCFAIIGCPVGIWANRSDYLSTFVTCFLPTVFVYYPLLLFGGNIGRDGKIALGLGCWMANIVVGLAGLLLTARLLRR